MSDGFSKRIEEVMAHLNFKAADLAEYLGVSKHTIHSWTSRGKQPRNADKLLPLQNKGINHIYVYHGNESGYDSIFNESAVDTSEGFDRKLMERTIRDAHEIAFDLNPDVNEKEIAPFALALYDYYKACALAKQNPSTPKILKIASEYNIRAA